MLANQCTPRSTARTLLASNENSSLASRRMTVVNEFAIGLLELLLLLQLHRL